MTDNTTVETLEQHTDAEPASPRQPGAQHDRNRELHRQWRRGLDALEQATGMTSHHTQPAECTAQCRRLCNRLREVGDRVVTENYGLVRWVAGGWLGGRHAEQMEAAALAALWRAWVRWDPDRSALSSWVKRFAHGECLDVVHFEEHPDKTDRGFTRRQQVLEEAERRRLAGEPADVASVAAALGVAETVVDQNLNEAQTVSLDQPVGDEDGAPLSDRVAAPEDEPADIDLPVDVEDALAAANTPRVSTEQMWALVAAHGLHGAPPSRLVDIAMQLGVKRGKVNGMVTAARTELTAAAQELAGD